MPPRYPAPTIETKAGEWRKVEILLDGVSVSRLWIVDRDMRIGAAVLKTAGIAGVGTDRKHRKRGLALRVLERSIQLMHEEEYDASFLYGIQDFYRRVGFATCFAQHGFSVDTRKAEAVRSPLRTRLITQADFGQVRSLYERQNRDRTGSVVRQRRWKDFVMGSGFGVSHATVVVYKPGARKRVLGYVHYDNVDDRCRAAEVGGQGDAVIGAIMRYLGERSVLLRRERVSFSCPNDHPVAVYARRLGYQDETRYERNAGAMGRSLHLPRFLTALIPELERLWPAEAPSRLVIRCGDEAATLLRRKEKVSVSTRSSGHGLQIVDTGVMMQLVMGYRDVDDAESGVSGSARELDLGRTLIPLRVGHMWWPDRF
mgnify:FL=1